MFLAKVLQSVTAVSAIALLMSPTCGSAVEKGSTPVKVRFAYSLSTTTFPILYAKEKGLFTKRDLDVKVTQYANFQAVYIAFRAGAADIGSGGLASIVNLRGHGVPMKVVWGTSRMSNDILVPPKSGITDPKQLKGKSIGVFGGASGTTANMFMAIMIKYFGFDPRVDAKVKYGASALLAGLLAKGDVAGFVSNDPITAIQLATGKAVSIGELSDIYAKHHGGYHPHAGALALADQFGKDHPKAIGKFLGAWLEAIRAFQSNPKLWLIMMKKHLHISDPAVANLLQQRVTKLFALEWSENNIQKEIKALKFINETAGRGFLDKIPDDAFVTSVTPE